LKFFICFELLADEVGDLRSERRFVRRLHRGIARHDRELQLFQRAAGVFVLLLELAVVVVGVLLVAHHVVEDGRGIRDPAEALRERHRRPLQRLQHFRRDDLFCRRLRELCQTQVPSFKTRRLRECHLAW
jgi:hypothetical protein